MPPRKEKDKAPCLGCGKECTGQQYSVLCTICSLWCHKECAGMSDAFYKNLELQMKEMGQAYWACRSCLSFCNKMNTQIKEVDKRVDKLMGKLEENTAGLKKADEKIEEVRKAVGKVERKQEDSEKRIEENMAEEMRAREAIRRNIIVHGIPEPDSRIKTDKERSEADLVECDHIFKATGARIGRKDIRFCRRIGERGQEKRPLLVGMKTEIIKTELLDAASELRHTAYKTVSICPDQTRMQRQADMEQKRKNTLNPDHVCASLNLSTFRGKI